MVEKGSFYCLNSNILNERSVVFNFRLGGIDCFLLDTYTVPECIIEGSRINELERKAGETLFDGVWSSLQ